MRCTNCNNEIDIETNECRYCGENTVRILTPEEKNGYDGLTIDSSGQEDCFTEKQSSNSYNRVYVGSINPGGNFLTKAVFVLLGIIISGFLFFVALPITLIIIAIAVFTWIVLGYLRK